MFGFPFPYSLFLLIPTYADSPAKFQPGNRARSPGTTRPSPLGSILHRNSFHSQIASDAAQRHTSTASYNRLAAPLEYRQDRTTGSPRMAKVHSVLTTATCLDCKCVLPFYYAITHQKMITLIFVGSLVSNLGLIPLHLRNFPPLLFTLSLPTLPHPNRPRRTTRKSYVEWFPIAPTFCESHGEKI